MLASPYANHPRDKWPKITETLVEAFPLQMAVLVESTEAAWEDLFGSSIGKSGLLIGKDIFLPAQATGVLLEKLIIQELHRRLPDWRGGAAKPEKDVIFTKNDRYSFEIKTSSSPRGLYGNRSTGHRAEGRTKFRSGYYLVLNYKLPTEVDQTRFIHRIRFGWIDDDDWVGQASPTGQQASIGSELAKLKLVTVR